MFIKSSCINCKTITIVKINKCEFGRTGFLNYGDEMVK